MAKMRGIADYLRRQVSDFGNRIGISSVLIHVLIVLVFGVWVPWKRASIFLNPVVTAVFCCLGVLFAGPAAAQVFGGDPPESTGDAAARIVWAAGYGEMMTVLI